MSLEGMMRTLILAVGVLLSTSAYAQTPNTNPVRLDADAASEECWPSSHIDKVVVQMADGTTKRGSLLCLGAGNFTLAEQQAVERFKLDDVRQIRKAADPVWDGAAKGASVGLVMLALCGGNCPPEVILRTALGYGMFGLILDAIDSNRDAIYRPAAVAREGRGGNVGGTRLIAGFRMTF
jgi:hypothetical protein